MIQRQFRDPKGSEPVGFSHGDFYLVVEAFDNAAGKLLPGAKVLFPELMSARQGEVEERVHILFQLVERWLVDVHHMACLEVRPAYDAA